MIQKCHRGILLILVCCLLTGCAPYSGEDEEITSLEKQPSLTYEIPSSTPHILVDTFGYSIDEKKEAIFICDELPKEFLVVRKDTDEIVYEGNVDEGKDGIGYGIFTELQEPGEYYLRCNTVGCSYPFVIEEKMVQTLMKQTFGSLKTLETAREERLKGMQILLLAYDLYPQSFPTNFWEVLKTWVEEIRSEIPEGETLKTYDEVAVFAKTSYLIESTDKEYAAMLLQEAEKGWNYIDRLEEKDLSGFLLASAEMFRLTGWYKYHQPVREELGKLAETQAWEKEQVLAVITYIDTAGNVDVSLCSNLTDVMLEQAREITKVSQKGKYLVREITASEITPSETETDYLLWDMVLLVTADYVITNHEYGNTIYNYLHYFRGRNETMKNYIEENADSFKFNVGYIMMLSQLIAMGEATPVEG